MNASLELLAVLAGVLTVLSPCILPILPALLSASVSQKNPHRPFWIVLGLATSFALFGTIFAVFKSFLGLTNGELRDAALAILLFFGLSLLMPRLWEHIGSTISTFIQRASWMSRLSAESGPAGTFLLGGALGLVWAPCAGPILGIILTLATVQASFLSTFLLMWAYALGAALPMLLIGYGGQKVVKRLQRFRGVGSVAPKVLGIVTLGAVAGLYFNLDTLLLSHLPSTLFLSNTVEQKLVAHAPSKASAHTVAETTAMNAPVPSSLPVLGAMPKFADITGWINSPPLTRKELRGKVVLVDFWTYSCINCIRTLPYVRRWYEKYKDQGLVVVGVHTPEFAFEKKTANVEKAVKQFGIPYPVAIDSRYGTWNAYSNQFWPAHYLIDAQGRIREVHFGEGDYKKTEKAIQSLLAEAGTLNKKVALSGPLALVNFMEIQSPETYLGYGRAERFASPETVEPDSTMNYSFPQSLGLNEWALLGTWRVEGEKAILKGPKGDVRFRFHAPKLNIVMKGSGEKVKARVFLDGKPLPVGLYGSDVAPDGSVTVRNAKLYNLVSLPGDDTGSHVFEIRFEAPGAAIYTFTFG
jgi:cytochrome c biogenesis protein CcdA/thiol-disulfide isomerase/thioredoxin